MGSKRRPQARFHDSSARGFKLGLAFLGAAKVPEGDRRFPGLLEGSGWEKRAKPGPWPLRSEKRSWTGCSRRSEPRATTSRPRSAPCWTAPALPAGLLRQLRRQGDCFLEAYGVGVAAPRAPRRWSAPPPTRAAGQLSGRASAPARRLDASRHRPRPDRRGRTPPVPKALSQARGDDTAAHSTFFDRRRGRRPANRRRRSPARA